MGFVDRKNIDEKHSGDEGHEAARIQGRCGHISLETLFPYIRSVIFLK